MAPWRTLIIIGQPPVRPLGRVLLVDLCHAEIEDLRVPPGNRLHSLEDDRAGEHSISVNDQWRICFRSEDGDAYDVEICDYH